MSTKKIIIGVSIAIFFTNLAFAEQLPEAVQINADNRIYERLSSYDIDHDYQGNDFFESIPLGLGNSIVSPSCDPKQFESEIFQEKLSTKQYFQKLNMYFRYCQRELNRNAVPGSLGLVRFSKVIYPFLSHPQVSSFLIKLSNGTKVPAILALKRDPRPRPLVILKCGVFCSAAQTASLKNYLMKIFDQSPFNVLILANQTGMDYIYHNKRILIGGWTEGEEVIEVGRWMKENWEHRSRISSMHLMGISLGGNAAMFGASYNDQLALPNGIRVYNSVVAICPVVSLGPTLGKLYESQFVGRIFEKTTKEHFLEARNYVKDVPDLISEKSFPSSRVDIPEYIGSLVVNSLTRRGIDIDSKKFFFNNNFWNISKNVKTPLLVWASKDDSVVNNRVNTQVVEHDDSYKNSDQVGVLNLMYGDHCGFSTAYGLQASSMVLRTFVLQHSPEFSGQYNKKKSVRWSYGFNKLAPQQEHIEQIWQFFSKNDKVRIQFKIFDWNKYSECSEKGPWDSPERCVHKREYWIPVSDLKELGARMPRTEAEAQSITREFNAKVEFLSNRKSIKGTNNKDFSMTWRSHFE